MMVSMGPYFLLGCSIAALLLGCPGSRASERESSIFRSNSPKSTPRRTAEDRPTSFKKEKGPFEADRMLINSYAHRTTPAHGEVHGNQALEFDGFSHPACLGIPRKQRAGCPLSDVKWTNFKDIPQGIALEAGSRMENLGFFRLRLLCHIAFGATHGKKASCPLHFPGVQVRLVKVHGSRIVLHIMTSDSSGEAALRKLVRRIFQ